jgi:hypothetical protein
VGKIYPTDRQLTDRLYSEGGHDFFHTDENGEFCNYVWIDYGSMVSICDNCNYKMSEKEKFIINLWKFNE